MENFKLKELVTQDIEHELEKIGFDSSYIKKAADKYRYKTIKIFDLSIAQANILKQTALTFGADCAVNREILTAKKLTTDTILGGSYSQLIKIAEKLKQQPFAMKILSKNILELLINKPRTTKIVGILNVTPDSFSDGGLYTDIKSAQKHLISMINDGADVIDIGAESTRPYSEEVPAEEQIKRLTPILKFIKSENLKTLTSVDTRSSIVAEFALDNGVNIINDVSGFDYDSLMPKIISKYQAQVIIQHSQGLPNNMQNNPTYSDVVEEIYKSLQSKLNLATDAGIKNIILDVGIGFGKSQKDNFEILNRIEEFYSLNSPIMVGVSRKSLLGLSNSNDNTLKDSLTLAISYPLIQKGVDYLRVHNVKLHKMLYELNKKTSKNA
ncbi:MAG: dihydropteroate synthase [bacterium]|nr:dihydropteroate synthase [bacterium]